jgi:hypothetical protein
MTDLGDALTAMGKAAPGYGKAVAYSDGPVTERFASRRVRRLLRGMGGSFQTVLGDVVIDAVADKLKVTAVTSDTDARTAKIAEFDEDNNMQLVRPEIMRRALQQGDAYLSAWPMLDDDGLVVKGKARADVHDARTARVMYDPENPTVPLFGIQRWQFGKRIRVDLLYRDRIERFISRKDCSGTDASDFEPYTEDGRDAEEPNPYDEIPLFHFHGIGLPGEYGTPEHKPFYGTQDTLIKLKSTHMAGVDFHGLPQRVALRDAGAKASSPSDLDADDFEISPDGLSTETVSGKDPASTLSSEPGSVWDLEGYKSVIQLDAADPKAFLDPAAYYLREGALASKTPLHLFDRTGQIPSGESLKTANDPLDSKTGKRLMSFNPQLKAYYRFVLRLLGEDDAPVSITWAPVESTDESTKLEQAGRKQELGVPTDQTLTEIGYTPDEVKAWLEDGDGGLPAKVALLAQLGDAVASFGTAVAAGLLDKSTVQTVITNLMGDLAAPGGE